MATDSADSAEDLDLTVPFPFRELAAIAAFFESVASRFPPSPDGLRFQAEHRSRASACRNAIKAHRALIERMVGTADPLDDVEADVQD